MNFSHLRLLAVFATVVDTGSFAAAARKLNSSRSRVSEQVSQLEKVLGVRLLQRSTRQLLVTDEGNSVYAEARTLPATLNNVEGIVSTSEPHGRVAITMNHDVAHKYVLPLLEDFQNQYPLINLDLILDDDKVDLIGGAVDLGIRVGPLQDSSLVGRVLYEESFGLFASPDYLQKHGTPTTVKQLEKYRWILLSQFSSDSTLRFRHRKNPVEITPTDYYRCNSPLMMQKMVIEGLGIAALLPGLVEEELAENRLVRVLPAIKSEPLIFSLVYPSRQQIPQRTRVVIDFLLSLKDRH